MERAAKPKKSAEPKKDKGTRMWQIELFEAAVKVRVSNRPPQTFKGKVIRLVRTNRGWLQLYRKGLPVLTIDLFTGHAQPDLPLQEACPPSLTPDS